MEITEKIDFILTEAKSKYFDEYVGYALIILKKLGLPDTDVTNKTKNVQMALSTIMGSMAQPEDNMNFKKYKKFFPEKFNKKLFDNADKNTEDSDWFKMSDDQHFTIFKNAILKYVKSKGLEINKLDLL